MPCATTAIKCKWSWRRRQPARAARKLKYLIVTGDDFGRSHEVNEAIERGHEAGFLTQASLMVNEPCADEAVRIAQRHPALCVGLHLTLCDGRASKLSPLTNAAAHFCVSPTRAGMLYAWRPSLARPLEEEIRAQFQRFRALGFGPTYWDGHTHLHLQWRVHRLTVPVAVEYGFRASRVVHEPGAWQLVPRILALMSAAAIPRLREHGIAYTDYTFGLRDTGRMTTAKASRILQSLPEGVSELYFHPGAEPEEMDYARLRALLDECSITLRTSLPPAAGR